MPELREGEQTLQVGLLMEAAQAQQRLAEDALRQLQAHLRNLDTVVRDEIQHTLSESLSGLAAETEQAAKALGRLRQAADLRVVASTVAVTLISAGVAVGAMRWMLPSRGQLEALQARRTALMADIARLKAAGAGIDLRRCGSSRRLCVRVERRGPAYGARGDYLLVEEN